MLLFLFLCDALLLLPLNGFITAWLLDFLATLLLSEAAEKAAHMMGDNFWVHRGRPCPIVWRGLLALALDMHGAPSICDDDDLSLCALLTSILDQSIILLSAYRHSLGLGCYPLDRLCLWFCCLEFLLPILVVVFCSSSPQLSIISTAVLHTSSCAYPYSQGMPRCGRYSLSLLGTVDIDRLCIGPGV